MLKKVKFDTKTDNIIAYLTSADDAGILLTPDEARTMDILMEIHGYRLRFKSKKQIIELLKKRFPDHQVSDRQYYNYISQCNAVFGTVERFDLDYLRQQLISEGLRLMRLSKSITDRADLLRIIYKISGMEDQKKGAPDFSLFQQATVNINIPDGYKQLLDTMVNKGGSIDMNKLFPQIEDIPFEEKKNPDHG